MYRGPIIDSDVHHTWKDQRDLVSYLPQHWKEFAQGPGDGRLVSLLPAGLTYPQRHGHNKRLETFPPGGGPAGSDYDLMKEQLLDRFNMERVILHYDTGLNVGHLNPYFGAALSQAANDWCIDHWLSGQDERFFGAVLIPSQIPELAAKEIRRIGRHPKMVEVLLTMSGIGRPLGHPLYHPIYEAAVEMGLPVAIHVAIVGPAAEFAGGRPGSRVEFHTLLSQPAQHHLVSLLTHGVFEKFPDLRIALVEVGISWIPWIIWNLDANYALLKRENPAIRHLPSEYFREHIRMTTQPMELSPQRDDLIELLDSFGGMEDTLCFATDYPHWDADDPLYTARRLPDSWLPKVFYQNALKFYRWPQPASVRDAVLRHA
jgi:predicted TIM-barrel fold metal-dependent hydrolase